jgi:small subunit ribosomal protein S2
MSKVTMRDMLAAGVHFGHRTCYWNPKMGSYIFGSREKIHIMNLEKTLPLFHDALNFVSSVAANHGKVLFVGTKSAACEIIREQARRCNMPYVDHRWLGGMLTNYKTVRQSINRLRDLEAMRDNGTFERMIKKEALQLSRELTKLERGLGGIKDMGGIPDALFVIDVGHEKISIQEAKRLSIPVIGIVDSNNSPDDVDYVIPGNDDSRRAIELYVKAAADVILAAKAEAEIEAAAKREAKAKAEAEAKKKKAAKAKEAKETAVDDSKEAAPAEPKAAASKEAAADAKAKADEKIVAGGDAS